jgi:hypothetical protein
MIELPRAALMAGEIAEAGEFFSFGTNDLTQTTLGVSRDDAGRFLGTYVDKGIYAKRPLRQPRCRRRRATDRRSPPNAAARPARHQAGHLRRTWRRSGVHRVLRKPGSITSVLLALPRADRASGGGAGGASMCLSPAVILRSAFLMRGLTWSLCETMSRREANRSGSPLPGKAKRFRLVSRPSVSVMIAGSLL